MISIVIPVYNEEGILEKSVKCLVRYLEKTNVSYEIIISNDGSADNTFEIIKRLSKTNPKIKFIHNKRNMGRGHALKKTCSLIRGSKILFMDADIPLITDLNIAIILKNLNKYDIVIGSRFLPESNTKRKLHRNLLSKIYRFLVRLFFPELKISDTLVGFKGFKRNVFVDINKHVKSNGWPWDLEFLLESKIRGYKINEVPITWHERGESSLNLFKDSLSHFFHLFVFRRKYGKYFS